MIGQFVINGLITGVLYSLLAIGFALVYNTTRLFHIVAAAIYVFAAFMFYLFAVPMGLPILIASLFAILLTMGLSLLTDVSVYRPLKMRKASNNVAMIASIGMMTVIVNLLAMFFGNETKVIDNTIHPSFVMGNLIITTPQMWQLVVGFFTLVAFLVFIGKTDWGIRFRALSSDSVLYETLGYNTSKTRTVVFTLLGFYLLGKIRFEMDTPVEHLSVFRLILVIIDFTFVVYMIPGMWGAPLKALSGYLPPITTQDFVLDPAQHGGGGTTYVVGRPQDEDGIPATRKYADFLHLPYDIPAFFDYEEARAYAAKVGKPLLIDFTGHGCVNCREMESRVWSDPRVLKLMKNDYVVCSLYGDDKKVLDKADWVTTEDGKVLKSLGKINSYFMMKRFHVNAQPYYAILDPVTEKHKAPSRSYNLDVDAYVDFLQKGLE